MHRTTRQALNASLLHVVDGCLAGVIFLVPLLMGGRHAVGQLGLTVLAVAAAWAWSVRQCLSDDTAWRPTRAAPLLIAGLLLVVLQSIPLSPVLLAYLSPHSAEILPLWNASSGNATTLGSWSCVSFTPAETQGGLVLFLDYILLFFVTLQRIRHTEDIERFLRWCALSATGMAAFGIVQYLGGNGKFFWFYEHPFSSTSGNVKGSFTNRNHFADFLALGIGPLIWWIQDLARDRRSRHSHAQNNGRQFVTADDFSESRREWGIYLLGFALTVVVFACLLSLSRGGIAAMFLAAMIAAVACYWISTISGRFVVALGGIGLLIGVCLSIFGLDHVSKRLDDFSSGSIEQLDHGAGRRVIWTAAAKAFPDFLPLGTGVGSFREVYPLYLDAVIDEDLEYTHAENSPLQVAVETGVVGLGLVLVGLVFCGMWCVEGMKPSNTTRLRACTAAIAASLAASVAHALVDFVWYVPACMAIVTVLAACAQRAAQMRCKEHGKRSKSQERLSLSADGKNGSRQQGKDGRHDILETGFASALSRNAQRHREDLPTTAASPSPFVWLTAAMAVSILGFWMVAYCVGPAGAQPYWDEYLVARHAAQNPCCSIKDSAMSDAAAQRRWIACLENVLQWQPAHPRASLALAETHRRLFDLLQADAENQMSLANIRDAAVQSRFPSREAMVEWLSRAIGKQWSHLEQALRYTRRAISLSPLQGRGYIYLADLTFLEGANSAVQNAYLQQAMRVRPYDGAVLYAAACHALLDGKPDRWLTYAKMAYQAGPGQQQRFIRDMAEATATEKLPEVIDFLLREFQPDLPCLRLLQEISAKRCSIELLTPLMTYRVQKVEAEAAEMNACKAVSLWIEAQCLHCQMHNDADALRCARQAVRGDAGNYEARSLLASRLVEQGKYSEAETHLRWCLQRKPNDANVQQVFRAALKGQLDGPRRTASEGECLR